MKKKAILTITALIVMSILFLASCDSPIAENLSTILAAAADNQDAAIDLLADATDDPAALQAAQQAQQLVAANAPAAGVPVVAPNAPAAQVPVVAPNAPAAQVPVVAPNAPVPAIDLAAAALNAIIAIQERVNDNTATNEADNLEELVTHAAAILAPPAPAGQQPSPAEQLAAMNRAMTTIPFWNALLGTGAGNQNPSNIVGAVDLRVAGLEALVTAAATAADAVHADQNNPDSAALVQAVEAIEVMVLGTGNAAGIESFLATANAAVGFNGVVTNAQIAFTTLQARLEGAPGANAGIVALVQAAFAAASAL